MPTTLKKITTTLVITSFLAVAFLSLTTLHTSRDEMASDCPFSPMGVSLCPQDSLAELTHHLAAYRTFFNVPLNLVLAIIVYISAFLWLLFVFTVLPPLQQPAPIRIDYGAPPPDSYRGRILSWLSLFENSPSST